MHHTTIQPTAAWINRVTALISSGDTGPTAVARFLPARTDPDYGEVLCRLVKTDLRTATGSARSSAYAEYRSVFPDLPPEEWDDDTDLTQTPLPPLLTLTQATRIRPLEVVSTEDPPTAFPKPGEAFGDFQLVDELGRGAFGRVYLATERKLADRLVALKITRKATNESQRLARLQHTNIVPIHNALTINGWTVVQMPFFGRQTLADLLSTVKAEKTFPKVSGGIFASTQMRASTSRKALSSNGTTINPLTSNPDSDRLTVPPAILAQAGERQPSREMLVGLSYTDAAVWIIHRMADGLAHAHAKDILHLDLKPHNVLLSDDGQPMLLDFNLSFDRKRMDRDRVGGTWPYMSPEQICEYARRPGSPVDERSDLFALGVMFFELLTTRQPFDPVLTTDAGLTAAIDARCAGAPDVRAFNPHVPASIAGVVAKLLAPAPIHRYQSADDLREDLRRHAENRPLAFAKNSSLQERATKWHRRNPKASLLTCVAVLLLGLFFTAAQMMAWSQDRQRHAAEEQAAAFRKDMIGLRLDLTSINDPALRRQAIKSADDWIQKYHVGQPHWTDEPELRLLPAGESKAIRNTLAETALLAAHAHWLNSRNAAPEENAAELKSALAFNAKAVTIYGNEAPAVVNRQRSELEGFPISSAAIVGDSAEEHFVQAVRHIAGGQYQEAATLLTTLTQRHPEHFAAQFALGICLDSLGQPARAAERYLVAKPLAPNDARPAFHRGLILYHQGRLEEAESDFTEAIQRDATKPLSYLQRGLARRSRGNSSGAIEDFTAELALPNGNRFIALAVRAQTHRSRNDEAAAIADEKALDTLEPKTDLEFVARATRWLESDPVKALNDYNKALKLNPDCMSALVNSSHIYAELLQQPELALAVQRKAVKAHGSISRVRAGHAVILARLGKRSEAHAEMEIALHLGSDAFVTYQAACVYALTSDEDNQDREKAIALFRQSLRDGYRQFQNIMNDADLIAVRNSDDYKRALSAAMELVK